MAARQFRFDIDWENDVSFEFSYKVDGGAKVIILKADENGNFGDLSGYMISICESFFKAELAKAVNEMKA